MKNLKLLFTLAMILVVVIACKKDDEEETTTQTDVVNVEKSTVSAKWEVEGDSDYETFEFNESGTYVVVKNSPDKNPNDQIIIYGTYTIDGNLMILSNFGNIKVIGLSETEMSFTIKLEGESDYGETLVASKSDELPASSNTELLCRTWKMFAINGDTVAGTEDDLYVIFFPSGTYAVTYMDNTGEEDIAQWKWYDDQENVICYSWEGEPDCTDVVEVVYLDAYRLEMSEEGYYYVLYPYENSKSSAATGFEGKNDVNWETGKFLRNQ